MPRVVDGVPGGALVHRAWVCQRIPGVGPSKAAKVTKQPKKRRCCLSPRLIGVREKIEYLDLSRGRVVYDGEDRVQKY